MNTFFKNCSIISFRKICLEGKVWLYYVSFPFVYVSFQFVVLPFVSWFYVSFQLDVLPFVSGVYVSSQFNVLPFVFVSTNLYNPQYVLYRISCICLKSLKTRFLSLCFREGNLQEDVQKDNSLQDNELGDKYLLFGSVYVLVVDFWTDPVYVS